MVVLIACDNDETLIRLRDYLTNAGMKARATRRLHEALQPGPEVDAVVLFPDDFDSTQVTSQLSSVLDSGSNRLIVLITGDSRTFGPLSASAGGARCVLMPKPVWSWTILDVLRASARPQP